MAEEATPVETGGESTEVESQETQAPQNDDYQQKIDARFDELSQTQQQLVEAYQSLLESQQGGEYDEDDDPLLEEGDEGYDQQELERAIDAMVQERLQPHLLRQTVAERDRSYNDLTARIPALADEQVAAPIVQQAVNWVRGNLGNEGIIHTPEFVGIVEMMYKAKLADERAAQETPAGSGSQVSLESAGGAAPEQEEESLEDRFIKHIGQRRSF